MNAVKKSIAVISVFTMLMLTHSALALERDDADIIGLKLGMTVEQVKKTIADYDKDFVLQPPMQRVYQYRVANKTIKTEPFISSLYAVAKDKQKGNVQIYFSMPPSEPRVVAISRSHNNFVPPITRENYSNALVDKYGQPVATQNDKQVNSERQMHWLQWHIGDKPQCLPYFSGGRQVQGPFGTIGMSSIEKGEVTQVIMSQKTDVNNLDLDNCASVLTYQLAYDPVNAATGILVDVSGIIKSEREVNQWIDSLAKQEEDKINSSTAKPKL
ncbi:hypothetical protein Q7C_2581 [Methylophaga frappieri]|uniref:Uncharacterized protein n=1 Tax=Methylophaga frappieri (strain ATCC BAA-2434 / DSM 25690 / JAM7) TaxID=754477 RepID=I1YLA9_METFJ|nr:hypothetical protein [Methylophaga frappieri]AFJ03702.1 hypothetical protein Q7C_2581 [Methylophaga frappieri]